jgi:hypothetical protein
VQMPLSGGKARAEVRANLGQVITARTGGFFSAWWTRALGLCACVCVVLVYLVK